MNAGEDYGPIQVLAPLGLRERWQVERAVRLGLLAPPDPVTGRWPRTAVTAAVAAAGPDGLRVGRVPDCGTHRAAEELTTRLGRDVDPDTVVELSRRGHLPAVGRWRGQVLYDGLAVEHAPLTGRDVADAAAAGRLLTLEAAAEHLAVRRVDVEHLIRAGRLRPARRVPGRRHSQTVPLLRTGDLDAVAADPGLDWPAVRATRPGRPSPLAALPTPTTTSTTASRTVPAAGAGKDTP